MINTESSIVRHIRTNSFQIRVLFVRGEAYQLKLRLARNLTILSSDRDFHVKRRWR